MLFANNYCEIWSSGILAGILGGTNMVQSLFLTLQVLVQPALISRCIAMILDT